MKILIAGDFVPYGRVAESINIGDYSCFDQVKPLVSEMDYSIVNFECPIVEHEAKAIQKIGPNIKCSANGVDAIKWAGFNCVTLANNHMNDYGSVGINDTINALKERGIDYVGAGNSLKEASHILYTKIGEKLLAIINCCEHEFSIATQNSPGCNPLDPISQFYVIQEAKAKADYVLVIVHGGHEGYQLPSPRMQQTYRFFIDAGADAVVNHHQHCYSGYEVYKKRPIFYGLGNFCFDTLFDNTSYTWYEGLLVAIVFEHDEVNFSIYPYYQCKNKAKIELLLNDAFDNLLEKLNEIIKEPHLIAENFDMFCNARNDIMLSDIMVPTGNRFLLAAARRHLIPSIITNNRLLRVCNLIRCESHKDILLNALLNRLNKN